MSIFNETTHLLSIWIFLWLASISEQQWVYDDDGCRTPGGGSGSCIPIKQCQHVTNIIQNLMRNPLGLSQNVVQILKGYQCGATSNSVKVCCPKNPIILETPTTTVELHGNECQTPDKHIGRCIPIKQCQHITDFFHNSWPLSQTFLGVLKSYECKTNNSVNVCCPNHPILIETRTVIVEPSKVNECITPDSHRGFCIPVKNCIHITDFITNSSPLSPQTTEFIRAYRCGPIMEWYVCCPNSPISMVTINIEAPTIIEQSPDVANHKNLKLLPEVCGLTSSSERITGGTKAELFEFPWMALLSYKTENGLEFKCGGTIINERYILTAAHCITTTRYKLIGVRVGEHNTMSERDCDTQPYSDEYCAPPVQDFAIEELIPHPKYSNKIFINDIGLVRLASPINTTVENAVPICLPITEALRKHNFTNKNLTVTGWGNTEAGHKSADLLKADVPIIPVDICRKAYSGTPLLINNVKQICAGGHDKRDSCTGDSGGPLQMLLLYNDNIRTVQFGVISFGPKRCGQEGIPGICTKIDFYLDWILDNMKP